MKIGISRSKIINYKIDIVVIQSLRNLQNDGVISIKPLSVISMQMDSGFKELFRIAANISCSTLP